MCLFRNSDYLIMFLISWFISQFYMLLVSVRAKNRFWFQLLLIFQKPSIDQRCLVRASRSNPVVCAQPSPQHCQQIQCRFHSVGNNLWEAAGRQLYYFDLVYKTTKTRSISRKLMCFVYSIYFLLFHYHFDLCWVFDQCVDYLIILNCSVNFRLYLLLIFSMIIWSLFWFRLFIDIFGFNF